MAGITTATYYRMTHVTGPGCVLVSLRFGRMPVEGPWITFRSAREAVIDPQMDVDAYIAEVLEGVSEANQEIGSAVEVEEIEIVPDDYPTRGQVKHCAKILARSYARGIEAGAAADEAAE